MKVILSGYNGTMGQVLKNYIEESTDLEIVAGVGRELLKEKFPTYISYSDVNEIADVIIDFSHHTGTNELVEYSIRTKTKVVIATTGHTLEELDLIRKLAKEVGVVYAGNYSLGVNVLVELVKKASELLLGYDIEVIEKHHNKKIDAPSGTAKMLVDAVKDAEQYNRVYGRHGDMKRTEKEIGIHAVRGGTIVGEHEVIFAGEDEMIEIKHTALSKKMFAKGSVTAAKWLVNQKTPNLYSMKDVLGIE
ncbi:4-hydroxy-tetrahydrodipicolinate reductase [Gemella cuniculi]|uniref:4-hydroxy-tetrahydrodipicolinate reductase n=1 Tax=Gemella cuniculi TaxID=150240 RepID=UPI0004269349|nr:4-hydroxy-tetrahydrodipicolinate reductase [Gemella cuniculi]